MGADKSNFRDQYEQPEALFPTALSPAARRNLRLFLDEDFRVYRKLNARFARKQTDVQQAS